MCVLGEKVDAAGQAFWGIEDINDFGSIIKSFCSDIKWY